MKIKTWLLLTYLLVMLLPLGALYGLYVSINSYYEDQNLEESFKGWATVLDLKEHLENPALYEDKHNSQTIQALSNERTMITLYSSSGRVLFTSNPLTKYSPFENKDTLYQNLFDMQQNFDTFVYKEPVYENGAIKGVYKITLARKEWTEQVQNKTTVVIIGLALFLVILYGAAVHYVNKRLNDPLKQLMQQMRAFAKGEDIKPLKLRRDEIGELTASFQQMQTEILANREKITNEQRQKEFMIASLSHDLKTPLTSIQAYAEGLRAGKLTADEQQDYAQTIETKAHYMKQLLDDLMMFTLLQSPSYTLELVTVEGEEFFDMLLGDYEQISRDKGFHPTTEIHVSKNYQVNPKQLMRVLDNLVSNAWTYTNPEGTIHLAVFEVPNIPNWVLKPIQQTATKQGAYIVVQNSGTTLTAEQCIQLFEPLYQLDEARSQIGQRGAGLGLSIAKQIIEKHHGTIEAVSYQNETAILIWLPEEETI